MVRHDRRMTKRAIVPAGMESTVSDVHYSPAVRVGNVVYCSGQVGRDQDLNVIADPEEQFRAVFNNVKLLLEEAGATLDDVVDLVTYHTSFDDFATFRAVKDEFFTGPVYPAWTGVGVAALARPGLLAEAKCIAVVGAEQP